MTQLDFSGPLLKVERADHHINQLEGLLGRYVAENRKRFSPKHQERAFKRGISVKFAEPERHTPTVLGDAIHNLRASLDHAYCVLIESNRNTVNSWSQLPIRKDRQGVSSAINGHIKDGHGPSQAVMDYILDEVEPYTGGKHNLWNLHQLDITDKHERILPMGSYAFFSRMDIADPGTGRIVAQLNECSFSGNSTIASGAVAILKHDVKNAFDVTFGKGQPLEDKPILSTLRELRASVKTVLKGLSGFL